MRLYQLCYRTVAGFKDEIYFYDTCDRKAKVQARLLLQGQQGTEPELWHEYYNGECRLVHRSYTKGE